MVTGTNIPPRPGWRPGNRPEPPVPDRQSRPCTAEAHDSRDTSYRGDSEYTGCLVRVIFTLALLGLIVWFNYYFYTQIFLPETFILLAALKFFGFLFIAVVSAVAVLALVAALGRGFD